MIHTKSKNQLFKSTNDKMILCLGNICSIKELNTGKFYEKPLQTGYKEYHEL